MPISVRTPSRPGEAGFTLVEVVVAMSIFAVMLPATIGVVMSITNGVVDNRSRVVAASLAASQIEIVRGAAATAAALPAPTPATRAIGGQTFTISQTSAAVDTQGTTITCLTSALAGGYTRVSVSVSWAGMGSSAPVRADTLVPGSSGGAVALTVTGASGQAVAGIPVTLTSKTTGAAATANTDGSGCAVFTGLGADTYTASADSAGYVSPANLQHATSNDIAVTAGSITKAKLTYDRAMTLTTRYVVADGSAPVSASQLDQIPAELKAGEAVSSGAITVGALTTGSLAPLYPAAYTVMGGASTQCTLASVDLSSGAPLSRTVDIPTADVKVSNWATLLAIGTIRAIYVGPATGSGDISCTPGTSVDTGTVFSFTGDHRATLPLGKWKIQVPWNVFGSYPIGGLTVYCYPVTLTSGSTGVTLIDFVSWLTTILLNPLNWFNGGC